VFPSVRKRQNPTIDIERGEIHPLPKSNERTDIMPKNTFAPVTHFDAKMLERPMVLKWFNYGDWERACLLVLAYSENMEAKKVATSRLCDVREYMSDHLTGDESNDSFYKPHTLHYYEEEAAYVPGVVIG
jgi:hypothetical protein